MKKATIIALALCTSMVLPGALYAEEAASSVPAGTAAAEDAAPTDAAPEEPQEEGGLKSLGSAAEGAFEVLLKNSTGKDIEVIKIRSSSDEDYGESLLEDGDVYAADEERILYYDPNSKAEETASEGEAAQTEASAPAETSSETPEQTEKEDFLLTDAYDIQVTFKPETEGGEGAVYELHSFPFEDIMEGEILLEGELLYLEYKSIATDENVSTKAYEEGIQAQKAAEEAAAQSSSETAEPVYQDYSQDYSYDDYSYDDGSYDYSYDAGNAYDYSYTEPSYTEPSYTEPSYTEPSYDNGGGDDQCITDGLIYE